MRVYDLVIGRFVTNHIKFGLDDMSQKRSHIYAQKDDMSQFIVCVLGQFVTILFWTICHKSYLSQFYFGRFVTCKSYLSQFYFGRFVTCRPYIIFVQNHNVAKKGTVIMGRYVGLGHIGWHGRFATIVFHTWIRLS